MPSSEARPEPPGGPAGAASREPANSCRTRGPWDALETLWGLSSLDRLRACRRYRLPAWDAPVIQVRDGRGSVAGLQTCGSIWACPMCGSRILAERAAELATGVERAHELGWSLVLQTQTLRHERADDLSALLDTLSAGRKALGQSRPLKRLRDRHGEQGYVLRVEITHGVNGWHAHLHALRFYAQQLDREQVREMEDVAAAAWQRGVRRVAPSFEPDREHGTDWRLLDLQGARAEVAAYVAKTPERLASTASAALEVAGSTGKSARRGSRTPWKILDDLGAYGDADDLTLWWEYEQATKGRRCIEWSRGGLRDQLVPTEERTDEEIAQQGDDQGDDVAVIPWETWKALRERRGAIGQLLALVGKVGQVEGARLCVHVQLVAWGLDPPDWPPGQAPPGVNVWGPQAAIA